MPNENLGGLPLPQDIPFQLIAASPDMMDMTFCNKKYPFEFRSSLAISAYEPEEDSLPENYCKKITYLKVTASLTGYKPTHEELNENIINFNGAGVEHDFNDFEYITRKYFPCFGALLNIAVFPLDKDLKNDLSKYPHITSFEPKRRELIEPMTKEGSMLTSSNNTISLGTKNSTTKNTGFDYKPKISAEAKGVKGSLELGGFSYSKNNIEENTMNFNSVSNDEIKKSHKTTIQQMYNMLDSYHLGTNRAVFNIMPYPHIKESTDFRTFTQGIKVLEGIQEFFLIVERPKDQEGLCIDVGLQTGHFPEDAEIIPSKPLYRSSTNTFEVSGRAKRGNQHPNIDYINEVYNAPAGYVIDRTKGNGGYSVLITNSIGHGNDNWNDTNSISVNDTTISVGAVLKANIKAGSGITVKFTVYLRAIEPYTNTVQQASLDDFLITSRGLCACYKFDNPCLEVIGVSQHPEKRGKEISDEINLKFKTSGDNFPLHSLFSKIKNNLYTSGQQPQRNKENEIGFFESQYFTKEMASLLNSEYLETPLSKLKIREIPKELKNLTVNEFLFRPIKSFSYLKGFKKSEMIKLKKQILIKK